MIRDEKTLRYKLHEVLTISEEGSALFKTESPEMEDLRSAKPSNEIVPQDEEEVKNFSLRDTEAVRRQQAKDKASWPSSTRLRIPKYPTRSSISPGRK